MIPQYLQYEWLTVLTHNSDGSQPLLTFKMVSALTRDLDGSQYYKQYGS